MNIPCSAALTVKHQTIATGATPEAYEELVAALPTEPMLYGDESPTKEGSTKAWLWTFVDVQGVELTNNAAERALRPAVIWRKISFGTQSAKGSRFVETLLSVIATCRQQGRDPFAYLTDAINARFHNKKAPSLLHGV